MTLSSTWLLTIFVQATKHIEGVIRLKATIVQDGRQHLRNSSKSHVLAMTVAVLSETDLKHLVQNCDIGVHTATGKNDLVSEFDNTGNVAARNGVTGSKTGITGDNGIILPRHGYHGSAIVFVGLETTI